MTLDEAREYIKRSAQSIKIEAYIWNINGVESFIIRAIGPENVTGYAQVFADRLTAEVDECFIDRMIEKARRHIKDVLR